MAWQGRENPPPAPCPVKLQLPLPEKAVELEPADEATSSKVTRGKLTSRAHHILKVEVLASEFDSDAQVDAMQDSGYFARWGEPQRENRGEHAGTYLGIRRIGGE